jgi:hypothetical protein
MKTTRLPGCVAASVSGLRQAFVPRPSEKTMNLRYSRGDTPTASTTSRGVWPDGSLKSVRTSRHAGTARSASA